jgi:hypothetical protein
MSAMVAAGGELFIMSGVTASLDGATISSGGMVTVEDSSTLALKGKVNNAGVIALDSVGNPTALSIIGATTLTGGGDIVMSDVAPAVSGGVANEIITSGTTSAKPFTLTNSDNTIKGAGVIGNGDATLQLSNSANAIDQR